MDANPAASRGVEKFEQTLIEDFSSSSSTADASREPVPRNSAPQGSGGSSSGRYQSWIGKRVSHFRIMRVIGEGTMGLVLQVDDTNLKRIAALKILMKQIEGSAQAEQVERFLLEAQSAAAIDHPSIAQVYEIHRHADWWYIAMEFMEGGSLKDLVQNSGPLPPGRAALLFVDAARGLAAAHEAGVIHRDIKPANLMLTRRGRCKLVDFGLAKLDSMENPFVEDDKLVVGTPDYVSPEVAHQRGASKASDIYSLGATLYAVLTGHPPYTGKTIRQILRGHIEDPPPDVREEVPACPAGIAELIKQAMAKNPAERPSAETFAAVLQTEVAAALSTDPPSSMRASSHSGTSSSAIMKSSGSINSSGTLQEPPNRLWWLGIASLVLLAFGLLAATVAVILHMANQSQSQVYAPPPAGPTAPGGSAESAAPANLPPVVNSIGMQLVYIPSTTFEMGSPPDEAERDVDERQFEARLTHPFYMAVTTVTQKQWKAVMGANYVSPDGVHPDDLMGEHFIGDSFPITCVNWDEAREFCRKLSEMESRTYRLPTEAEWECCCRAGTITPFSFGPALTFRQANVDPQAPYGAQPPADDKGDPMRPMPVASFPPNAWGLYDMHGNVMQWCSDWYGDYPLGSAVDPTGPDKGVNRVVRGGSWLHPAKIARSASRWSCPSVIRANYIGFRVVLSADAEKPH